ncbi:tripartite tricarboxylate transporter substrate binding protein [Bradyrhizobium sp. LHD-71]|uniref:Bug family tripartite tricarboxylate transporter substrate binding protein n=1 Tax=Bradyrhizobium sp. LHD-71 TaxID=3072141 RepID=UPI0028104611|nr:tripartite tricarboxylate transporter substrate binding protein [Bradyrhizobium sp. LHD-71]MDQ8731974.1 tripartite tricarboxylate transporter substrate binding protein [Bradyrhizobium sp. LHD-71]
MNALRWTLTLAVLFAGTICAHANYPDRPIRIIVGFAAGGATDILARAVGESLHRQFGQPVIIENKPGANARIAAELVAKAPADGYTLTVATVGALAIGVHIPPKPNYDTLRDFAPIGLLAVNDGVLLVKNDFPAKDFQEFVKLLKQSPGKFGFGTSGFASPTHLAGELLKRTAGIDMHHIPYKGDAQALADLVGGHLDIGLLVMASASGQVKSGGVRALAALGSERMKDFPNLKTVAEMGFPGYSGGSWIGLLAPAGTPPDIISKLSEALRRLSSEPEFIKTMETSGSRPAYNTPIEFGAYIKTEWDRWGAVIRETNMKGE